MTKQKLQKAYIGHIDFKMKKGDIQNFIAAEVSRLVSYERQKLANEVSAIRNLQKRVESLEMRIASLDLRKKIINLKGKKIRM